MNKIDKQHPYSKINFNNVVYLGAGNGDGLEELINALNAKHWTLIEGNEKKARQLASTVSQLNNKSDINVKQAVVSAKGGEQTWYNYNLNEFSGLKQASGLKELFPGLKLQGPQPIETEALSTLLAEISGKDAGGNNALIIDLPGYGTELINALQNSGELQRWSFLAITAPESVLFDQGDDVEKLQQKLTDLNYHTRGETGDDPDFPVLYYVMSEAQRKLVAERDAAVAEKDEALALASSRSEELDEAKQKNAEWVSSLKSEKKDLEQKLQESWKQLKQAQTQAQRYKNESDELQKKLEATEKNSEQLAKLNERMDSMFEQQRLQLEQAINALGQHITQTSSQQVTELKARLSLERSFGRNLVELSDNNSNLNEITAVSLTQQLEENSYDLIIEFGAGKSTEFLANAIINNHNPNRQLENKSASNDFSASDFDLPQQVLSFEYDKKQFNAVKKRIEQNNLQSLVDLKYTPLVPTEHSSHLFYDCARTLTNVANLLEGREAKVLIVVNPSSEQSGLHYESTLSVILGSLSALQLDILLNNSMATKALQQDWSQLLKCRSLPSEEKRGNGVYLLRINP
ncbi:hypothetical protein [Idiomarina ramblicola]|uniref:Uncharacterized protein n=1 Tax=Idiomarina ramblicola TaxID=263724 RepID=A0A432Z1M3_9GAMM|nr:hypothetical protein [Idiomarina ramblicola]RUO71792.1 hypothetical protein CWI78_04550 [Idiomarina ramblicola]